MSTDGDADDEGAPHQHHDSDIHRQVNSLHHFQQHSRLHFIGQWRSKAEDYLRLVYQEHPEWCHGVLQQQSIFVHVDMDAYFCSVALSKPENAAFRSRPVAIAAGKQNSDVSSCNYIARQHGVRAGMWVGEAKVLCPDLVVLGYDLARCEELNQEMYRALLSLCPAGVSMSLEVYSVDEVVIAMDTSDYGLVEQYCHAAREEIQRVTHGCTASCGVGPSILVARLATAKAKPDGVCVVQPEAAAQMVAEAPLEALHGNGRVTLAKLRLLLLHRHPQLRICKDPPPATNAPPRMPGLQRATDNALSDEPTALPTDEEACAEESGDRSDVSIAKLPCSYLVSVPLAQLQSAIGQKAGLLLHQQCRGIDERRVRRTGDAENQVLLGKTLPNSVACAMNYAVRPLSGGDVIDIIKQLIGDVAAKLRRFHALATTMRVTLLERHPDYPKETTKFLGTGRCVEYHIPVHLPTALTGEQEADMLAQCSTMVTPWLTACQKEKAEHPRRKILVEDIRGATVQCCGLHPIMRRVDSASDMVPHIRRAIGSGSMSDQISLTAAFRTVSERKRLRVVESIDSDSDVLTATPPVQILTDGASCHVLSASSVEDEKTLAASEKVIAALDSIDSCFETSIAALKEMVEQSSCGEDVALVAERLIEWHVERRDLASPRGLLRGMALWVSFGQLQLEVFRRVSHFANAKVAGYLRQEGMRCAEEEPVCVLKLL